MRTERAVETEALVWESKDVRSSLSLPTNNNIVSCIAVSRTFSDVLFTTTLRSRHHCAHLIHGETEAREMVSFSQGHGADRYQCGVSNPGL